MAGELDDNFKDYAPVVNLTVADDPNSSTSEDDEEPGAISQDAVPTTAPQCGELGHPLPAFEVDSTTYSLSDGTDGMQGWYTIFQIYYEASPCDRLAGLMR